MQPQERKAGTAVNSKYPRLANVKVIKTHDRKNSMAEDLEEGERHYDYCIVLKSLYSTDYYRAYGEAENSSPVLGVL